MRPSLSRVPGLFVSLALAIAPSLAWAAPTRVDLPRSQSTSQEVRWQPTQKTEAVTGPWELVGSRTWVDKTRPHAMLLKFQEYRTDDYRQRTTTYSLEAKEQRTKTTTTQPYELRTYAEQSTSSTVMRLVTKEVGEWTEQTVDKPVTTTIQVTSTEPWLYESQVPVYKTVMATYSIPPKAVYTTLSYDTLVQVPETKTVTKTRTESYTTTQRVRYNGRMIDHVTGKNWGTVTMWTSEDGLMLDCPDLRLRNVSMRFTDGSKTKLTYTQQGWGRVGSEPQIGGTCIVTTANGVHYLEFEGDLRHAAWGHWWGAKIKVKLDSLLAYDKEVPATRDVAYTETVTTMTSSRSTIPFEIQLEQVSSGLADLQGESTTVGNFWKHHHVPDRPCPYRMVIPKFSYKIGFGAVVEDSELRAADQGPLLGSLPERLAPLAENAQRLFPIIKHHTAGLPTFTDDLTPATIGERPESVIDHYETRQQWTTKPRLVSKEVPVQTVVGWVDRGIGYEYAHTHDDPAVRCLPLHLRQTAAAGRPLPGKGGVQAGRASTASRYGNNLSLDAVAGPVTYRHLKEPQFGPLTEKVTTTSWATRSVTVMEPRTVTSTFSVLVGTVSGQEITTAYSPWTPTGELRRAGSNVREATRSQSVPGRMWVQDLTPPVHTAAVMPLKAQSSTFASDRVTGTARQNLSGNLVQRTLKTRAAISSKPRPVPPRGGTTPNPTPNPGGGNGGTVGIYSTTLPPAAQAGSLPGGFAKAIEKVTEKAGNDKKEKDKEKGKGPNPGR